MENRLAKAFFVFFHCLFVIGGSFSLNKGYGVLESYIPEF